MNLFYLSFILFNLMCTIYTFNISDSVIECQNRKLKEENKDRKEVISFILPDNVKDPNLCPNVKKSHNILSRKKRFLAYPEGSNFVITLSLVKALLIGLPLGWNQALELDIFYKTPGVKDIIRPVRHKLALGHRQRRSIWSSFEDSLDYSGAKGQACIIRTICEVKQFLLPKDKNLVHDLLRILFSAPDVGGPNDIYTAAGSLDNCAANGCPFSLLELLLSYDRVWKN